MGIMHRFQKQFDELFQSMGIKKDEIVELVSDSLWEDLNPDEIESLKSSGLDIDLDKVFKGDDGFLQHRGRRVVLYIKNARPHYHRPKSISVKNLSKVHLTECKTLEEMRSKKRFERYVVSNRTDGYFTIDLQGSGEKDYKLHVCHHCLIQMNYRGFKQLIPAERKDLKEKFDFVDHFEIGGGYSGILPKYTDKNGPRNEYSHDWDKISLKFRESKNFTCEECKIDLNNNKKYLDAHHKNHNIQDNRRDNLEALCVYCHAHRDSHQHMQRTSRYLEYYFKYIKEK